MLLWKVLHWEKLSGTFTFSLETVKVFSYSSYCFLLFPSCCESWARVQHWTTDRYLLFSFLREEPGKYLILQILAQKLTVHFGISHLQWNATVLFPVECLEVCVCSSIMEAQRPFSYQCNSPLIHHGCSLLSMHERVCVRVLLNNEQGDAPGLCWMEILHPEGSKRQEKTSSGQAIPCAFLFPPFPALDLVRFMIHRTGL